MKIFGEKRGAEIAQPLTGTAFSLARLLGQEAYDTDPIKTDGDALKAYSGWVYACVSTIAQDVRSSTWNVWSKTGSRREDWTALEGSQVPAVLLRPNATQTWGDLIELTQTHLDLAGRAFWHLVTTPGGTGSVVGIQTLNPDWVQKAVYSEDRTRIIGWEIATGGSSRRVIPSDDVVLFRYPDPIDPTGGVSPIRAVAMSADMDTYSRAYAASHLRNHAQPTGILTTEAELTRDQASTLADAWTDTHQGNQRIQVLGKGANFQTLSAHIKDLEFLNLARVSRDQILAAYHMPASKLGLVEDSSRANGEEADRVYSALCLGPRLRRYEEPITYRVLPRLGLDANRYAFEFNAVEVGDKLFERDAAQTAFSAGAITLDEYRERIGFEPAADGRGAVYFVPMGSKVVEAPEDAAIAPVPFADSQSSREIPVTLERSPQLEVPDRELEEPSQERMEIAALRFIRSQSEAERRMRGRLRAVFSRMQKSIVASAKAGRLRSAPDELETRASIDLIPDLIRVFDEDFREILEQEAARAYEEGHEALAAELSHGVHGSLAIDFALVSPDVERWAAELAGRKITEISATTEEQVREVLAASLAENESIDELADRLRGKFDEFKGFRAETIARTETAGSFNYGKFAHAAQIDDENDDVATFKTWVPTQDERTREAHRAENIARRTIPIDEPFTIDSESMMRPHDPQGSAENVVRCRCVLTMDIREVTT